MRVLIVEDDSGLRNMLRITIRSIKDEGIGDIEVVATCATLQDVQDLAESEIATIDVATVDGRFPLRRDRNVEDLEAGRLAAEHLRRVHPDVKIIAISGTEDSKPSWADVFLRKPFAATTLEATLRKFAASDQREPS